jgi:hypothetical protein
MVLDANLSAGSRVLPRRDMSMAASRKVTYLILFLGLLGGALAVIATRLLTEPRPAIVTRMARKPVWPSRLDGAPQEVREFLGRVLAKIPDSHPPVTGYQFSHWEWADKPTHEAMGLKAIPGADPQEVIARVMDVNRYPAHIAHVEACRSQQDSTPKPPEEVHFFQVIRIPAVAKVQHELVLADAGTVQGYRVAYWYLLKDKTQSLDPKVAARSDFNMGAWLVAPGVVGYALSSWPRRDDVNTLQWVSLTSGANALAKKAIEGNIDGMAAWARKPPDSSP